MLIKESSVFSLFRPDVEHEADGTVDGKVNDQAECVLLWLLHNVANYTVSKKLNWNVDTSQQVF